MEKLQKMEENLFYNIRHLKTFKEITKNEAIVWGYRWPDGKPIEVFNKHNNELLFTLGHDIQLAEYICSLHNMSNKLVKEVESKYVS